MTQPRRGRAKTVEGAQSVKAIFVHTRDTTKMGRYDEVPPGREPPVIRSLYVDREALKRLAAGAGISVAKAPPVLEVTVRVVDAKEFEGRSDAGA